METIIKHISCARTSWVISEGKVVRIDPTEFDPEAASGDVKEYRISEIGRYLIHPGPIEIRKRLVGCEVHPVQNRLSSLRQCWPQGNSARRPKTELLLAGLKLKIPVLKDPDLDAHFRKMIDELRMYDPFAKKLAHLNVSRPSQLIGICEDIGGGYSYLKLQGTIDDKIRYLTSHVGRDVRVTIHRAHVSEGLFELRAFPAGGFNPANSVQLFTYSRRDGETAACVLTPLGNLDFRLPDPRFIKYLSLLEHSLIACPNLRQAFDTCFLKQARPLRLFFNRQVEVDYSNSNFPEIYRDVFRASETAASSRNLVKPVLNNLQTAVSLSFLPPAESGEDRMLTHVCILHDLRALEPLRLSLPGVYAEMSRRAFSSEAGRYYVLDSMTGASHVE